MTSVSFRNVSRWSPESKLIANALITIGSVFLCLLVLPSRLPGMEILAIGPNWLLIWVVAWSVKRTQIQGCMAGVVLGLLQDGMTAPFPSHSIGLAVAGFLTGRLQKQKYIQEDFISVALIVFGMAIVSETITALQFLLVGRSVMGLWIDYQRIVLVSAILSSLWAPIIYYPLNRWWSSIQVNDKKVK